MLPLAALPPLWAVLLRMTNPSTDATSVPIVMMDAHMQVSVRSSEQSGDSLRSAAIVDGARAVLVRYADVKTAERDGYHLFHAESAGNEEHYTSSAASMAETKRLTVDRPGSLLYRRNAGGTKTIVGVMYGAPAAATPADLNARAPLSTARWHRHIDFCVPPGRTPPTDPRFGWPRNR